MSKDLIWKGGGIKDRKWGEERELTLVENLSLPPSN